MRDPMAVKIGQRIRDARDEKRWRLRELAVHAGLSETRLGNYETGERMPGPSEILAIAGAVGESPAYLMGLTDDQKPDEVRNGKEAALLQLYRTVEPEDRRRALERLGALALLKKEAIQDAELGLLSAKGKHLEPHGVAARRASRRRTPAKRT